MPSTDSLSNSGDSSSGSERRQHPRQVPNSLAYVHLDETNGGILINLSEGGLAVQAAMSVMEDQIPRVRLQAPRSTTWLETGARVVWSSDSRRMVGLEFIDAPEGFEDGIRNWLAAEIAASQAKPDAHVVAPSGLDAEVIAPLPTREEIRPRGERYASMTHTAQREKDFDLAALLTSTEGAKAVLAPERQDVAHASATRLPVESKFDDEPEKQTRKGSSARYIPLLTVLAALSLIAGWAVGRGSAIEALFQSSAAAPPSGPNAAMLSVAATNAAADFEVVDATNQSWLVPYAGPTSVPQNTPSVLIPPRVVPPSQPAHASAAQEFKVAPLTAPQSVARAHNMQASAAPSLPDIQGANASLPASVADTGTRVNVAPPPVATAPAPSYSALVPAKLTKRIDPTYPKEAVDQRIEGTVRLHAHISPSGSVSNVTALSGSRLLEPAAISAVSKWQYAPEMLDGHPVASEIDISIVFSLPR